MPSLAVSHSVGRTDPPMNSMVQTGQVMMNMMREVIYERNREIYNIIRTCLSNNSIDTTLHFPCLFIEMFLCFRYFHYWHKKVAVMNNVIIFFHKLAWVDIVLLCLA